ncbi:hypothetical protein NE848_03120 [Gramella jeungdoensis]|uniref:Uncharacterized protein n=1 Tax=Gramella jeungdoensis TaxID=708091 RepID=A0ABT0YY10_9FLAO|nr:hypothetical protein [Gramella jeungdoensis]MCM8568352.1 hypothetical protein [Gramella jeungdoensis]
MKTEVIEIKTKEAEELIRKFAERTALVQGKGDPGQRYLWTDAFALNCLFGLFHITGSNQYHEKAYQLIELVHEHLGKYHPDDKRKGWISGLTDEKAEFHPTVGGLRIGKRLPERKEDEALDQRLEWERDGQYFHYLTKWINGLLQADTETENDQYARWAAELLAATSAFIVNGTQDPKMYWKMDTGLSRPLVSGMGAHDPLEGLICTVNILRRFPDRTSQFNYMLRSFESICSQQTWTTSDPLAIGGLLTDSIRAIILEKEDAPVDLNAESLLQESINSLNDYQKQDLKAGAGQRLAFRECGLSLGIRILKGMKEKLGIQSISNAQMQCYELLANEIENFWLDPENQKSPTWKEHLDINSVSLAASLIACSHPEVFLGIPKRA